MTRAKKTPEWILSAYESGVELRMAKGPNWAQGRAQRLQRRIKRGTSRRYSTRSTLAVVAGLLGHECPAN